MTELHDRVASVTERIRLRSHDRRRAYLEDIAAMEASPDSDRRQVGCSNMAHAAAAAGEDQQNVLAAGDRRAANIGIITAYNDMLSAHQPFETYPQVIRAAARAAGGTAQGATTASATYRLSATSSPTGSGLGTRSTESRMISSASANGVNDMFQCPRNTPTKLHGRCSLSSWSRIMPSQAVRQAPVDPGIQKITVPFASPANARD